MYDACCASRSPHDVARRYCLELNCAAALVTRISFPSGGSASTAIERTRLTSRLANAAAVIAGASDRGRLQLLQVMQCQHRHVWGK